MIVVPVEGLGPLGWGVGGESGRLTIGGESLLAPGENSGKGRTFIPWNRTDSYLREHLTG